PDEQGDASAIHDSAERVPPEVIGPEQVLTTRRSDAITDIACVSVMRRKDGREQRHRDHYEDNHQPDRRHLVPTPQPELILNPGPTCDSAVQRRALNRVCALVPADHEYLILGSRYA